MVMNKWSGVETGIQDRLKICCPIGRVGSSPTRTTEKKFKKDLAD